MSIEGYYDNQRKHVNLRVTNVLSGDVGEMKTV